MDRRLFLQALGLSVAGATVINSPLAKALATVSGANGKNKTLVVIFLRGAADSLSMVVPVQESHFTKSQRPNLYLPSLQDSDLVRLNSDFVLHPALKPLQTYWQDRNMAVIHQVGSVHNTRSHFDAQDFMESGTPGIKSTSDGFLTRSLAGLSQSPLKAVALQPTLPRIFAGSAEAFAMNSIQDFARGKQFSSSSLTAGFESLYEEALDEALKGASRQSFNAVKLLKSLPENAPMTKYPSSPLGKHLADIARLVKGQVGLQVAVTESGGWDTHRQQGGEEGALANRLADLAQSLSAFMSDIEKSKDEVTVVTMTEFGRTVKENGTKGTDHGHGSCMFVLGRNVKGKEILGDWKSLKEENLHEGRDLPVTTDFREAWSEILVRQLGAKDLEGIFPDYKRSNTLKGKILV